MAEEPKPAADQISLKVKDQEGNALTFKVKRSTTVKKIRETYARQKQIDVNIVIAQLDGERLADEDTVDTLELQDHDQVDIVIHQEGGAACGHGQARRKS